jgi:hypothetical protein
MSSSSELVYDMLQQSRSDLPILEQQPAQAIDYVASLGETRYGR